MTSEGIFLYHETVDDLRAGARVCDLCRLVIASVEKALAAMKKANKYHCSYIIEGHQLWMCGTFMGDGVEIMGLGGTREDKLYLFCGLRFSVAEGEYKTDRPSPSPPFLYYTPL